MDNLDERHIRAIENAVEKTVNGKLDKAMVEIRKEIQCLKDILEPITTGTAVVKGIVRFLSWLGGAVITAMAAWLAIKGWFQ